MTHPWEVRYPSAVDGWYIPSCGFCSFGVKKRDPVEALAVLNDHIVSEHVLTDQAHSTIREALEQARVVIAAAMGHAFDVCNPDEPVACFGCETFYAVTKALGGPQFQRRDERSNR